MDNLLGVCLEEGALIVQQHLIKLSTYSAFFPNDHEGVLCFSKSIFETRISCWVS